MNTQVFENYLKQTQQIAQRLPSDPSALLDIMQAIEKHRSATQGNPEAWDEFFKGESTFYSGQYEKALQHYLTAKEIPHYHFFCFRTSCFVARARGNQEQATKFAKKALKLNSSDEMLKQFLHDLNSCGQEVEEEQVPKNSIEEKEFAELTSIFEESPRKAEGLFSRELDDPSLTIKEEDKSYLEQKETVTGLEEVFQTFSSPNRETAMNTGSDIFSSPDTQQAHKQDTLTQRLYSLNKKTEETENTPLSALKRLAEERPTSFSSVESSNGKKMGLEERIENFQTMQAQQLKTYLNYTNRRPIITDNALFVLNGWGEHLSLEVDTQEPSKAQGLFLTEETRKSTGGLFLRWNGNGIVINPSVGFLNYFHEQGFSLHDIQTVIVTRDAPSAYADIKAIYELNDKLNKLGNDLHIIHYYLNQKAYQNLTSTLKPNFKQARNTVHNLELFIDSPDVEKIDISNEIVLHYFEASSQESSYKHPHNKTEHTNRSTLGIRLELRDEKGAHTPIRLGYISGAAWSPLLAHHLGICEILVSGFGNTSPNDYTKISYQDDSLGYHGTYSLLEEVAPKLFISTEFGGREGDIRLEAIKKLRQDIANCGRKLPQESVIIPGDIGLHVDLKTLKIKCSVTHQYTNPQTIRITKSTDSFGRLLYLSSSCCL